ncbi:hypothetical protein P885DRAFT_82074 [Corynascus similis CBS 632.67]
MEVDGQEEEEYVEPATDLQIPERAQLAEILCNQLDNLSPAELLELRIQAAELISSCTGRRHGEGGVSWIGPDNLCWCQWAFQIASALTEMHQRGLTHIDLKPANVVITANFDAVLIDVSGIGGVTRDWLSPPDSKLDQLYASPHSR